MAAAVAAIGAQAGVTDTEVRNDSTTLILDQIEVVANRATSKTPVAFTNISKQELNRNNDGRDMTYLLQSTPSVTVTSDAG